MGVRRLTMGGDPFLEVETGGEPRRVPLASLAVCRIGRSEHNSVVVADDLASREHAMIRRDASGLCYLSDSGSRNGTTLNGRPVIVPMPLGDGDTIGIGQQRLRFHQPNMPAPAAAAGTAAATQFFAAQSLITVLVIDIRGFTPLSREIGEARISAVMSEVFGAAGEMLERAQSWSQKFIGDAIMGVWRHEGSAISAGELAAILHLVSELEGVVAEIAPRMGLLRPIRFGGAINTGYASIGNMGSARFADFTALGDSVNKAFRLEKASKDLGCDLVIGRSTLEFLLPQLARNQLPPATEVEMKGYDAAEPVNMLKFAEIAWFARVVAESGRSRTLLNPAPR